MKLIIRIRTSFLAVAILSLVGLTNIVGQSAFVTFDPSSDRVVLPLEVHSNLLLLPVRINGFPPLKFIFDTGAENVLLFEGSLAPLLGLKPYRTVWLTGADQQQKLEAFVSVGVDMRIGSVSCERQNVVVMKDQQLDINEYVGTEVHGILGANLFRHYVMKIDYQRATLTLTRRNAFSHPGKKFKELPLEMKNNKPYLRADIFTGIDKLSHLRLLLDTGAGLGLVVATHTHPKLSVPDHALTTSVGIGLSGHVEGYVGRTKQLNIGPFDFDEVITNYQELPDSVVRIFPDAKNGLVGNLLLNRFTLVLDYMNEKVYMRPTRKFKHSFKYDKSGLTLISAGANLNRFYVNYVVKGSPADRAGIVRGDRILNFNGLPATMLSLNGVINKLQGKDGKKMQVSIERGEEKLKFTFKLEKIL